MEQLEVSDPTAMVRWAPLYITGYGVILWQSSLGYSNWSTDYHSELGYDIDPLTDMPGTWGQSPRAFGFNRLTWPELLRATVVQIEPLGYVVKRNTWVTDPQTSEIGSKVPWG